MALTHSSSAAHQQTPPHCTVLLEAHALLKQDVSYSREKWGVVTGYDELGKNEILLDDTGSIAQSSVKGAGQAKRETSLRDRPHVDAYCE